MNSAKFFLLPILTLGISTGFSQNQQNQRSPQQGTISKVSVKKAPSNTEDLLRNVLQMQVKTGKYVKSIQKELLETQQSLQNTNESVQKIEQKMEENAKHLSGLGQGVKEVGASIHSSFNNEKVQEAAEEIGRLMNTVDNMLGSNQSSGNYVSADYKNVNQNSNSEKNYNKSSQQTNYDQFNSNINVKQNAFLVEDQKFEDQEFEENDEINDDDDDLLRDIAAFLD